MGARDKGGKRFGHCRGRLFLSLSEVESHFGNEMRERRAEKKGGEGRGTHRRGG